MRILHLLKHCEHSNGHVNVAVDLACTHAQDGHTVILASCGGFYVSLLQSVGVHHRYIKQSGSTIEMLLALSAIIRLCRDVRPDIIHAHMMSGAVLGFLASRLIGVPLVTTMHNSFDRHSGLMRLGNAVVAVSEAESRLLLSRGYPKRKLAVIYNGPVGSPRDALAQVPATRLPSPCVITVSGLHDRKGLRYLISAFAALALEFPEWHLNIVGDGPERATLEELTRDLELTESIHFIGAVVSPRALLEQADIFALASLAEPFGLVLAEARAAGCALVATNVGGIPEVLDYGRAGQLVPPANPTWMSKTLGDLMQRPEERETWRERSRQGSERFTVRRMADAYHGLYQKLQPGVGQRAV